MSEDRNNFKVQSSALSDRGLNERRPLNEDAFLADRERSIFAVADGVGGAEAGEVASQTAIEVLDEAFRHQVDGADVEDLMELAIQRANASIHQMAQEHAKFSMMATTIVALHLKGNIATFGHVGDSRLYRLTPDGQLHRETEDHSIVEEEVRAGRMTPEQAANHPSKNVISRALGAEQGVEVDMKTMEVEEGTEFLLCTDGITRHVPDNEIRQLLVLNSDLEEVCRELKRRCYDRGAEDNLTVVIVRVGRHVNADERAAELEPTISPETEPVYAVQSNGGHQTVVGSHSNGSSLSGSRIAIPASAPVTAAATPSTPLNVAAPRARQGSGVARLFAVLFVLLLLAAAFYAGARYKERIPFLASKTTQPVAPAPVTTAPPEEPFVQFERSRRQVDHNPAAWLAAEPQKELVKAGVQNPLDSPDAEFLYLYGRANLLSGNTDEAGKAFDAAIAKSDANPASPASATIKRDAVLGLAAISVRTQRDRWKVLNHYEELTKPPASTNTPSTP